MQFFTFDLWRGGKKQKDHQLPYAFNVCIAFSEQLFTFFLLQAENITPPLPPTILLARSNTHHWQPGFSAPAAAAL